MSHEEGLLLLDIILYVEMLDLLHPSGNHEDEACEKHWKTERNTCDKILN